MKNSYVTCTDQFCGAGGSSLGAVAAGAEVKLAMNHWKLAIDTHQTNHQNTRHVCTDISAADPRHYPSTDVLITSPECTNHSLAKGKKRKDQRQDQMFDDGPLPIEAEERSRATMWDVVRFAEEHDYRIIIVENVVDARLWRLWDSWMRAMTDPLSGLGYACQVVYLNSMFAHPTPQSRDRMYCVFWKQGNRAPNLDIRPSAYCHKCARNVPAVQSWKNPSKPYGKYRQQYLYLCPDCAARVEPYYFCAANAIDWLLPVERIGSRTRPLKPKTLARIQAGLKKFSRTGFVVETAYSHAPDNRFKGMDEPIPTQAARQSLGLLAPPFILNTTQRNQDSGFIRSLQEAGFTQTTAQTMGFVIPPFMLDHIHEYRTRGIDEPVSTVVAEGNHQSVVVPPLIIEMWNTSTASPVTDALATVVAGGNHHDLLVPPWLMGCYTPGTHRQLTDAIGTITTQDHNSLVVPPPFLTGYYGTGENNHSILEASSTVTTVDRQALVQPGANIRVEDCGFRMLQPHEIGRAMAFPDTYKVLGNSREKVKQYGNAVTPPVLQMIMERCLETLN
jgi:DNA (cytosine-5)-methyltransferase 1